MLIQNRGLSYVYSNSVAEAFQSAGAASQAGDGGDDPNAGAGAAAGQGSSGSQQMGALDTGAGTDGVATSADRAGNIDSGGSAGGNSDDSRGSGEDDAAPRSWTDVYTKYAKGDEKLEKRLGRYSSIESALDALIAAQNKIASGNTKSSLNPDASPEELAAWRAENGIPDSAEGYELSLPEGYEMDGEAEDFATKFVEAAHEANVPPELADKIWQKLLSEQIAQAEHQADLMEANRQTAIEELRQEWGADYRLNSNMVMNLLNTAPEGLSDLLMGGTLADGTPIGQSVEAMRWLAHLAREINPVATVVPGSGEVAAQNIDSEIARLTKLSGDLNSEYWKGAQAKELQDRLYKLIEARDKYAAREQSRRDPSRVG